MKKLLSPALLSALTLCLTMQFSQAMKKGLDEDDHKSLVFLPIEMQAKIAIKGLDNGLDFYFSAVRVCKAWRKFLEPLVINQHEAKQLEDSDLKDYPDIRILILDKLGNDDGITSISNAGLTTLTNLTWLSLIGNWNITDEGIHSLTQLKHLYIRNRSISKKFFISNRGIKGLTNLQTLMLPSKSNGQNVTLSGKGLKALTNLTDLDLSWNEEFLIEDIMHLTNLTTLNLNHTGKSMKDRGGIERLTQLKTLLYLNAKKKLSRINCHRIRKLTNLTRLHLTPSKTTTDDDVEVLTHLMNLTELKLSLDHRHLRVTDEGLKFVNHLPNLATFKLDLKQNLQITDKGILYLTNLSHLTINKNIAFKGVKNMTNISGLDLGNQKSVTHKIKYLTNLTSLKLNENESVTTQELLFLTNLTYLNLGNNRNFCKDIYKTTLTGSFVKSLPKLTRLAQGIYYTTQLNFPEDPAKKMIEDDGNLKILEMEISRLANNDCLTINENTAFKGMKNLTNITSLDLGNQKSISHKIKYLTNLTSLNLNRNASMTEQELSSLKGLTCLNLGDNKNLRSLRYGLQTGHPEVLTILPNLRRLGWEASGTKWVDRVGRSCYFSGQ